MEQDDPLTGEQTSGTLIATLVEQGISEDLARKMAAVAVEESAGEIRAEERSLPQLAPDAEQIALDTALQLAYATSGGRIRRPELLRTATPAICALATNTRTRRRCATRGWWKRKAAR